MLVTEYCTLATEYWYKSSFEHSSESFAVEYRDYGEYCNETNQLSLLPHCYLALADQDGTRIDNGLIG